MKKKGLGRPAKLVTETESVTFKCSPTMRAALVARIDYETNLGTLIRRAIRGYFDLPVEEAERVVMIPETEKSFQGEPEALSKEATDEPGSQPR